MERIIVNLKTVTATFLHVEPRGEARWRAAPFRGVARWWFRALMGASMPPAEVRAREDKLFGTAESPSAVLFRVLPVSGTPIEARINPGPQGNKRYEARSGALAAGAQARLEITSTVGTRLDMTAAHEAYAAVWLALHFGGVGQRSRRGAGSLQMTDLRGVNAPKPVDVLDQASYRTQLEQGLEGVRRILGASTVRDVGNEAEFPMLHANCASAWVARLRLQGGGGRGSSDRGEDARLAIMEARRGINSHRAGKLEREFGGLKPSRLSSPVWVRVAAIVEGSALLVVTLLRHRGAGGAADWRNVENFVKSMDPNALPVNLGG